MDGSEGQRSLRRDESGVAETVRQLQEGDRAKSGYSEDRYNKLKIIYLQNRILGLRNKGLMTDVPISVQLTGHSYQNKLV